MIGRTFELPYPTGNLYLVENEGIVNETAGAYRHTHIHTHTVRIYPTLQQQNQSITNAGKPVRILILPSLSFSNKQAKIVKRIRRNYSEKKSPSATGGRMHIYVLGLP